MKTDTELQHAIMAELTWEPSIRAVEIGVAVRNGVVTLNGAVDTYAQKYAAERAVERVAGVRAIAEDLEVVTSSELQKEDPDIARAAANVLLWDVEVPTDRVKAVVRKGWVTLEGAVDWFFQKAAAERAVRNLAGVKGVVNLIDIKAPSVSTVQVKKDIEAALKRGATLDARNIQVEASDDTVTLRGTVRSWAEREGAAHAAWGAPGVRHVKDELRVGL